MTVHPHAIAFEESASDYELGRPGYPDALLEWIERRLPLVAGRTVVDLGAGTGKLTRLLVRCPARVVAVEPMAAMRAEFSRILPGTEIIDATAESMPLPDASADLVTCGQSIKWFATDEALDEIARVLRPAGELVLAFNSYDNSSPLQRKLSEIQEVARVETVEKKPGLDWREVIEQNRHFRLADEAVLTNEHRLDRAGLFGRVRSSSQFVRLEPERQSELLAELETLVAGTTISLTLRTEAFAYERVGKS